MSTSEKLQTGFLAILSGMTVPIAILNMLGGIVSGIWLAFLGEWGAIGRGLIIMVISGFAISFALMPALLFAAPAAIAIEKGKKIIGAIFGSLSVLYTVALITVWCIWIMVMFASSATENSLVPLLIWSYGVALGPWMWLAQKDQHGGGNEFSIFTTFCAQIAYILAMIMVFVGATLGTIVISFGAIMLIGSIIQISIVFYSETKRTSSSSNKIASNRVDTFVAFDEGAEIKEEDIEDVYSKYIDKENLSGSLSRINELLNSSGENCLELLDSKAEVLNLMCRPDEAIEIYERILDKDKNYVNAYVALATIYQSKEIEKDRKYSKKIVDLYKALENVNSDRVSHYVLGDALENEGDLEEALLHYKKAIDQEKGDNYFLENIYTKMAKIFTEQKKFIDAIRAYDIAIQCSVAEHGDDSHCSEIYAFKRDIYERMKDWQKAKEMGRMFAVAERLYSERSKFPEKEYHDNRLTNIYKDLEELGKKEQETSDDLCRLVLLMIEDHYQDQKISYEKLGKIIDGVLEEVEYDEKTRVIEKARLINLVSDQIHND